MKKIILTVIVILFMDSVYCDEKQDMSTILNPHIFNNNLYAQNDLLTNKTNDAQHVTKETISITPMLKRPKTCFSLSLDTIILPGIQLGYGWIVYDSTYTSEEFITIHANTLGTITAIGIYLKKTNFKNEERVGWFGFWKLGIDYGITDLFIAGPGVASSSSGNKPLIFPIISAGLGYSWKVGNNSFYRITGDVGIKLLIANITLSYVF